VVILNISPKVPPGQSKIVNVDTTASSNWHVLPSLSLILPSPSPRYHVVMSISAGGACPFNSSEYTRIFRGHMETAVASASDPALSRPVTGAEELQPVAMPRDLLHATSDEESKRRLQSVCGSSRRARMKDLCWANGDSQPPKPSL
jgi:hypothetical protein